MFDRLQGWEPRVVASNRNLLTGERPVSEGPSFVTVWTSPYSGNSWQRILNWISYAITATAYGLRTKRPSVVYASSPHLLAGLAGWLIARLRRAVFVLEIRDIWPRILVEMGTMSESNPVYKALRRLELFLYRRADQIVVMAAGSIGALERDGVPRDKIHLIPNGADPADFVSARDPETTRMEFGLSRLDFVFAYTGAHGPANGLDLVLDAAREVAEKAPEIRFLLVGDGPTKEQLARRVASEALSNVVFHGPVPKDEIRHLLAAVDVGLHVLADVPLFRYGVSPNKLFDYMAAGRPVLTNVPGEVGGLVTEADAGLAVAPHDIAAGALRLAEADHGQLQAWGRNGRTFMQQERSRTALAAQLQSVLDSAVR
jgi:glycosyltransferase involved in cell wall biosynthesis